jgi:hypothetical protein
MQGLTSRLVTTAALAIVVTHSVHAASTVRCTAEVLQAESRPYAPIGSWLTRATLILQPSGASPFVVTLQEALPWQMAIRKGDNFRIPCELASIDGLSLRDLALAPAFRTYGVRSPSLRMGR